MAPVTATQYTTEAVRTTTSPPWPNYHEYLTFNQSSAFITPQELSRWRSGTACRNDRLTNHSSFTDGTFHCPMPFEPPHYIRCCGSQGQGHCCQGNGHSTLQLWGIGISVACACVLVLGVVICLYVKWRKSGNNSRAPRSLIKLHAGRYSVAPLNRRLLLKTANYSVEQIEDKIIVKFLNKDYFDKLLEALCKRYKHLQWRNMEADHEGVVTSSTGVPVSLSVMPSDHVIHITKPGNLTWVMNDFQNICKNLVVTEITESHSRPSSSARCLEPRLPTIGEEFIDAGDYKVKVCQTEIEVKFLSDLTFCTFRRFLDNRYPTAAWSKYLQRDCCQVGIDSGKTVTLHLWEDVCTIWVAGDGRKDWYMSVFQSVISDILKGRVPNSARHRKSISSASSGRRSGLATPSIASYRDYPVSYTVKTLDQGGYEIDFATNQYLPIIKSTITEQHPAKLWKCYTSRQVVSLSTASGHSVTVHVSSENSDMNKMWIFDDPGCKDWFNSEFKQLYSAAYEVVHNISEVQPVMDIQDEGAIAPVESPV